MFIQNVFGERAELRIHATVDVDDDAKKYKLNK